MNWWRDWASFHTVFYFLLRYSKWSSPWPSAEVALWDAHTLQPAAVPGRVRALRAMNSHGAFTCIAGYHRHITLLTGTGPSTQVIAHSALSSDPRGPGQICLRLGLWLTQTIADYFCPSLRGRCPFGIWGLPCSLSGDRSACSASITAVCLQGWKRKTWPLADHWPQVGVMGSIFLGIRRHLSKRTAEPSSRQVMLHICHQ